ncbi:DgyrCDS795 [Dimorphilus gyrociliatus]|uniref:DgyrCDS795 n=1 Tax=Dimorphilus gyrociliatus TaxID=2664684 RepID=A0A7I8V889_9ANNE|nr:DgyrCDS795 [Dimorphilus gyrociliatus]
MNLENEDEISIYISSTPLMRDEKEAFKKTYWSQIEYLCKNNGVNLKLIDPWENSMSVPDPSQIIQTNLNKISGSRIFIGLYGQDISSTYNESNEQTLQSAFDKALSDYPWIGQFRDIDLIELELMHGFLNNPDKIPTCICFRSSTTEKIETISEQSKSIFNRLKQDVAKHKKTALGVKVDYESPKKGAEFVFKCIEKHLKEYFNHSHKRFSVLTCHEDYSFIQCKLHVKEQFNHDVLNNYIHNSSSVTPLCFVGQSGSGKSALLANWKKDLLKSCENYDVFLFHVGCDNDTTKIRNILIAMYCFLCKILETETIFTLFEKTFSKAVDNVENTLLEYKSRLKKKPIMIIDGLNRIEVGCNFKPLCWLTDRMLNGAYFILSTTPSDDKHIKILFKDNKTLRIAKTRLMSIFEKEETNNLLFYNLFMRDICEISKASILKERINELMNVKTITALIELILKRLERILINDPESFRNILSSLITVKTGLPESILKDYSKLTENLWEKFFYSLKMFLISRNGCWRLNPRLFFKYLTEGEKVMIMQITNSRFLRITLYFIEEIIKDYRLGYSCKVEDAVAICLKISLCLDKLLDETLTPELALCWLELFAKATEFNTEAYSILHVFENANLKNSLELDNHLKKYLLFVEKNKNSLSAFEISLTIAEIANFYFKMDQLDKTEELCLQSLKIMQDSTFDEPNIRTAQSFFYLANLVYEREKPNEADEYLCKSLEIFKLLDTDNSEYIGDIYYKMLEIEMHKKDINEQKILNLCQKTTSIYRNIYDNLDEKFIMMISRMAYCFFKIDQMNLAEKYILEFFKLKEIAIPEIFYQEDFIKRFVEVEKYETAKTLILYIRKSHIYGDFDIYDEILDLCNKKLGN